jgi:hypothetical protein
LQEYDRRTPIFQIDTGGTRKLTITRQTPSNIDNLFALSDDMLLGRLHAASDIYSPLFGPVMGFKTNTYNTVNPPTVADASRFGEKPFLIYTSWLLNRRFGNRKRAGQGHFGHSISRSVMREAISSFPGPESRSAHKRFRGWVVFLLQACCCSVLADDKLLQGIWIPALFMVCSIPLPY